MPDYRITQQHLQQAVNEQIISAQQAQQLWALLERQSVNTPKLSTGHVLYYLGGLLAIGSITVFVGSSLDLLMGWPLFAIGVVAFAGSYLLANSFQQKNLLIPAGIFAAICLSLTPLIVFSLQAAVHLLPNDFKAYQKFYRLVDGIWLPLELISLLVGGLLFNKFRFGFILFPFAILLWFTSMDAYQFATHQTLSTNGGALFSLLFGLAEIFLILRWDWSATNLRAQKLFWLYFAAALNFWGGLTTLWANLHLDAIYVIINIILLFGSVFLQRRIFALCGGVGIFAFISSLVAHSPVFPFVLVLLGLLLIYLAWIWSKFELRIVNRYQKFIPLRFQNIK